MTSIIIQIINDKINIRIYGHSLNKTTCALITNICDSLADYIDKICSIDSDRAIQILGLDQNRIINNINNNKNLLYIYQKQIPYFDITLNQDSELCLFIINMLRNIACNNDGVNFNNDGVNFNSDEVNFNTDGVELNENE